MSKLVLFDLDGTLTNPFEGITKCVQYALESFGIHEPELEKLTPFIGPPLIDSFMDFYNFTEEEATEAVKKYRERFSTVGLFENEPYEGIPEMLKELRKQGYILAVASSKPEVFVNRILEHFHMSQYFHVIVGSELDGSRTAKNEVIEEVFRRLQHKVEDYDVAMMVGDREYDVMGAKRWNMTSIGVTYGFAFPGELERAGADYVVSTINDLLKTITNN
jgi:phosphoglycolate phosphatase